MIPDLDHLKRAYAVKQNPARHRETLPSPVR